MQCRPQQALAWRLRRQGLAEPLAASTTEVVRQVLAVRGWPYTGADFSVRLRQEKPHQHGLDQALSAGTVIRSYAFRGGSYAFVPEVAAVVLSARTATKIWETRRWQKQGSFALADWEPLRDAVCTALADGPLTRDELARRLTQIPALRSLATASRGAGADSLYKPLHWWGDICFGPTHEGQPTFRLLRGDPRWPGLADVDDAGRECIKLYLGAYGPATRLNVDYWLNDGLGVPRRMIDEWLSDLREQITEIDLDGTTAYALTTDVNSLCSAKPTDTVRLLPAYDPWILSPGTADPTLVPPGRRALLSRGANPMIWRGLVTGTWRMRGGTIEVSWFEEAGTHPTSAIRNEVNRIACLHDRELTVDLRSSS